MEKQNVINRLSTGLKHERLAYKIYGIVALVLAIIIMVCGVVMMVGGAFLTANETYTNELSFNSSIDIADDDANVYIGDGKIEIADDDVSVYIDGSEVEITEGDVAILAGAGVIFVSGFYIGFGAVLLAVAIVNLVMASKVGKYRYSEVLTVKHAGSVGSIVVAALFNEIALIFVIINFVYAKRNRAILEG
ncbi:MAG: hypothetical protein IKK10_02475 [Clostridia bacterium]|nr:hypothetical protein [Clostridia bacterium]